MFFLAVKLTFFFFFPNSRFIFQIQKSTIIILDKENIRKNVKFYGQKTTSHFKKREKGARSIDTKFYISKNVKKPGFTKKKFTHESRKKKFPILSYRLVFPFHLSLSSFSVRIALQLN